MEHLYSFLEPILYEKSGLGPIFLLIVSQMLISLLPKWICQCGINFLSKKYGFTDNQN